MSTLDFCKITWKLSSMFLYLYLDNLQLSNLYSCIYIHIFFFLETWVFTERPAKSKCQNWKRFKRKGIQFFSSAIFFWGVFFHVISHITHLRTMKNNKKTFTWNKNMPPDLYIYAASNFFSFVNLWHMA